MATRTKDGAGPLSLAAAALEAELGRYEQLVRDLGGTTITSDKTLQRARRSLEDCGSLEQSLSAALQGFAQAMQATQDRQQSCMEATVAAARRVEARFHARGALLERMKVLGERAREINEPVVAAINAGADGGAAEPLLSTLQTASDLTASIISDAEALQRAAKDDDWVDIERDTDALKQQLQAARNKILAAQRQVASRSPS
jgi:hypothetical protein